MAEKTLRKQLWIDGTLYDRLMAEAIKQRRSAIKQGELYIEAGLNTEGK